MDAERLAGGHPGHRGNGPSKTRADRFLPAAGGQRPAGGQRGARPVDGVGAIAEGGANWKKNRKDKTPCGLTDVVSGDAWTV